MILKTWQSKNWSSGLRDLGKVSKTPGKGSMKTVAGNKSALPDASAQLQMISTPDWIEVIQDCECLSHLPAANINPL